MQCLKNNFYKTLFSKTSAGTKKMTSLTVKCSTISKTKYFVVNFIKYRAKIFIDIWL